MATPLTDHFTVEELTRSRDGIPNDPPTEVAGNLLRVAEKLEQARAIWAKKLGHECFVRVSYAYRGPKLNAAVGSKDTSAHLLGLAADAIPGGLTLREAFDALVADPHFMEDIDQLIIERGCIHIGLPVPAHDNVARRELRLDKDVNGVRTYPLFGHWTPHGVVLSKEGARGL